MNPINIAIFSFIICCIICLLVIHLAVQAIQRARDAHDYSRKRADDAIAVCDMAAQVFGQLLNDTEQLNTPRASLLLDNVCAAKMIHEVDNILPWPSATANGLFRVQARRLESLEDLLSSARAIALRRGADTAWKRFDMRLASFDISPITAKTFRVHADENPAEA